MVNMIETLVYAGRIKDNSILLNSSSGGAFTALSDYFLKNENAVVSTIYNYKNHTAEYKMILNQQQRDSAKGSKYMQSKPGNIYKTAYNWLINNPNKKLLFVGMGCQADGFRKYCEIKGVREQVYIVDIICHGSSSPKIWREYAKLIQEKKKGKITYLTFKDKRNGWKFPTAYVVVNGKEKFINNYVKIFYNRCALRPSCYECPYATIERKTDITIGDYWHIDETIPDFYDSNGNSLFIIHTNRGKKLFERIKDNLDYRLSDTTQCWQMNLESPTPRSENRGIFWQDYYSKGIDYIIKKYGSESINVRIKNKVIKWINNIVQNDK